MTLSPLGGIRFYGFCGLGLGEFVRSVQFSHSNQHDHVLDLTFFGSGTKEVLTDTSRFGARGDQEAIANLHAEGQGQGVPAEAFSALFGTDGGIFGDDTAAGLPVFEFGSQEDVR